MTTKILIEGGKKLSGEIEISAAKNAALPILAASILTEGEICIENLPRLADVDTIIELLRGLGGLFPSNEDSCFRVKMKEITSHVAPYELVKTMRASILVLGPLISRYGVARVSLPGGCAIGLRPIDQHLRALEKLGARITLNQGYVEARASRLKGNVIDFDISTVTGTENIMMAATLAKGTTIINNAAREPEVVDLADLLNKMGARIHGSGTDSIVIDGVPALKGANHSIIPDRIEAGTFLVAGAITHGDVFVKRCKPIHIEAILEKLNQSGFGLDIYDYGVRIKGVEEIKPVDIITLPYPGFPTDMQAQFMALMCLAEGSCVITETVFENRFMHVAELIRMGADISIKGNKAIVNGVKKLLGAPVMATDLRASASLIIAGLAAMGTTEISRIYHINRGYERIEEKLKKLGAKIKRVKS